MEAGPRELRQDMVAAGVPMDRLLAVEAFLHEIRHEVGRTSRLCTELDELVRPEFVLNTGAARGRSASSRGLSEAVVHRATGVDLLRPDFFSTVCGWRWGRSDHAKPMVAAEVEQAGALWTKCPRCFPA